MPIFEDIAIDLCNSGDTIDLASLFRRPGPVHIEIGSGKGTFLLNEARYFPEINFLGIEWANKYYRYCVDRMCRWEMDNVRLLRTDAAQFVAQAIDDQVVDTFHVYFPDPWPKKRHHKRRFINGINVRQMHRCLVNGGQIRMATDHADYYAVMEEVFCGISDVSGLFERIDFLPANAADKGEWVGTNFERKYRKEGRSIYTLAVCKRD